MGMTGVRLVWMVAAGLAAGAAIGYAQTREAPGAAEAGQAGYEESCSVCHLSDLAGAFEAPQLAGPNFLALWGQRPTAELIELIKASMPPGQGGSLSAQAYADITAYILQVNGLLGASTVSPPVSTEARPPVDASPATAIFAEVSRFRPVSEDELRAPPPGDWLMFRRTYDGWGYSPLDQITRDNVHQLSLAWVWSMTDGRNQPTPLVRDGVMYLVNPGNVVQALEAGTGTLLWEYRRELPQSLRAGVSRNLAVLDDLVYLSTQDAYLVALDARTGDTRWRWQTPEDRPQMVPSWQGVGLSDELLFVGLRTSEVAAIDRDTGELVWATAIGTVPQEIGEMVTTAPMYARGRVYAGVASGDSGGQGRIVALDAESGEIDWTFFIVPRPGEFGHDTWPQDSNTWQMGGGGVWLVGTVDPDLGLVYFATGNPVPMFGGEIRAGDNLFTASVVAVDTETGELRWHYQVVRHDVWDADIATPLLLYETQVDGQPRKALAAMRADGFLFLFDRETGEPLLPIEQRPVPQDPGQLTAATQPFPIGAESILPDCAYWRDRVPPPFQLNCSGFTPPTVDAHTVVAPGAPIPRVRVTPMSHSPQTGFIYAQGMAHVGRIRRFADPWLVNTGDVQITLPDALGIIAAVDTATGRVDWKHEVPTRILGTSGT